MSPELRAVIDAAIDLAWRPTANIVAGYADRNESAERLRERLAACPPLAASASDELRYLLEAIHRTVACSFANRMGVAYYERKRTVAELRGCLTAWQQSVGHA